MIDQTIYGGRYRVTRDSRHVYTVYDLDGDSPGGEILQGIFNVTQAGRMMAKPMLIPWASKIGVDTAIAAVKSGLYVETTSLKELYSLANKERKRRLEVAGSRGQSIHAFLEGAINSRIAGQTFFDPVDKTVKAAYDEFVQWEAQHTIEWIAAERVLFHLDKRYVGTADAVCVIDGTRTILDFKTGGGIYPDHGLQLAAYASADLAELVMTEDLGVDESFAYPNRMILHFDGKKNERLKQYDERAIQKKTGGDVVMDFDAFAACLDLLKWKTGSASAWELKK